MKIKLALVLQTVIGVMVWIIGLVFLVFCVIVIGGAFLITGVGQRIKEVKQWLQRRWQMSAKRKQARE